MRKETRLLKDHTHGPPVWRQKNAARAVLPDLTIDGEMSLQTRLKPGQRAKTCALACAGRPEQRAESCGRQMQGDIKLEAAAKGMPIPMHPGAERYLKEKGVAM